MHARFVCLCVPACAERVQARNACGRESRLEVAKRVILGDPKQPVVRVRCVIQLRCSAWVLRPFHRAIVPLALELCPPVRVAEQHEVVLAAHLAWGTPGSPITHSRGTRRAHVLLRPDQRVRVPVDDPVGVVRVAACVCRAHRCISIYDMCFHITCRAPLCTQRAS